MRESAVEAYLHKQVVAAGGWTYKFVSPGRANVPDRIVIWPGSVSFHARVAFIETKRPKKDATPAQAREHKRLRDRGCTVLVIDTKALVDAYVAVNK